MRLIARPDAAFVFSHPAHAIALGFGAGLVRQAPGTAATLAVWPLGWFLGGLVAPAMLLAAMLAAFALGVWACELTGRHLGADDHPAMVWDEIVAFLIVLAIVPRDPAWHTAAFVLFRAFDIAKPEPIAWIERRCHGGFGAMLDDLLAAGYTLLVLAALKRLLG